MAKIQIDWVQTARLNAAEIDKEHMVDCTGEEAALLRGLADEIERLRKESHLHKRAADRWRPCKGHRDEPRIGLCQICRIEKIRTALAFAASVIKSGEPWTDRCEEEIGSLLSVSAPAPEGGK